MSLKRDCVDLFNICGKYFIPTFHNDIVGMFDYQNKIEDIIDYFILGLN